MAVINSPPNNDLVLQATTPQPAQPKKNLVEHRDEHAELPQSQASQLNGIVRPTPVRPHSVQLRADSNMIQQTKTNDDFNHPYSSVRDLLKNVQAKIREKQKLDE